MARRSESVTGYIRKSTGKPVEGYTREVDRPDRVGSAIDKADSALRRRRDKKNNTSLSQTIANGGRIIYDDPAKLKPTVDEEVAEYNTLFRASGLPVPEEDKLRALIKAGTAEHYFERIRLIDHSKWLDEVEAKRKDLIRRTKAKEKAEKRSTGKKPKRKPDTQAQLDFAYGLTWVNRYRRIRHWFKWATDKEYANNYTRMKVEKRKREQTKRKVSDRMDAYYDANGKLGRRYHMLRLSFACKDPVYAKEVRKVMGKPKKQKSKPKTKPIEEPTPTTDTPTEKTTAPRRRQPQHQPVMVPETVTA